MVSAFEMAWAAYPRRVAKGKAREAFQRAMRKTTLDAILTALEWQRELPTWQERDEVGALRWVPHFSTWLNQERWDDERPQKGLGTNAAIVAFQMKETCGECIDGWREDEMRRVHRCRCQMPQMRRA